MHNSDRRNPSRRSSEHIKDDYRKEERRYRLPSNDLISAIIIGLGGGIMALAFPVLIAYINASLFNQAASDVSKSGEVTSNQTAILFSAWQCVGIVVDLVIAVIFGVITGRVVAQAWLGLVTGAVGGGVVSLGLFLAQYIPGYPGVTATSITGTLLQHASRFITLFVPYALLGALICLVVAWAKIRTRPHYHSRQQE